MGLIKIATIVRAEPLIVYNTLKELERLHEFMPQIRSVKILWKLPQNRQISQWEVAVEGITICWKQEDTYEDELFTLTFRVIEGDYKAEGLWTAAKMSEPSKSLVSLSVKFDWGIPNLAQYVGPVLERKAKKNFARMIAALRRNFWVGRPAIHG